MAFPEIINPRSVRDPGDLHEDSDWAGDLTRLQEVEHDTRLVDADQELLDVEPDLPGPRRFRRRVFIAVAAVVAAAAIGVPAWFASGWLLGGTSSKPVSGRLVIQTQPDGATVFVDGVMRGVTPINVSLAPGPHQVDVTAGHASRSLPVTIAAGSLVTHHLEFQATPTFGGLLIETDPPGAAVAVDGEPRGTAPVLLDDLLPGQHEVRLQSEAGSVARTVAIVAGTRSSLFVPLIPRGVPVSGWLAVKAPVELQIFENGRLLGTSAADRLMLATGRHDLEVSNDVLAFRLAIEVNIRPGQVVTVPVDLPKGVLHINAAPWAEVWIDGVRAGETPLGNVSVTIGPHEVVFRHPQLGEQRHALTVTLAAPARLSVDLRK